MLQKKSLAILGGGTGSLVAALEIMQNPSRREHYREIVLYQMGHRLGSKGASGRSGPNARIQEHGLHIWMGCYDNAFRMMRRVYEELDRPAGAKLARWDEAFKPHGYGGGGGFDAAILLHPEAADLVAAIHALMPVVVVIPESESLVEAYIAGGADEILYDSELETLGRALTRAAARWRARAAAERCPTDERVVARAGWLHRCGYGAQPGAEGRGKRLLP